MCQGRRQSKDTLSFKGEIPETVLFWRKDVCWRDKKEEKQIMAKGRDKPKREKKKPKKKKHEVYTI